MNSIIIAAYPEPNFIYILAKSFHLQNPVCVIRGYVSPASFQLPKVLEPKDIADPAQVSGSTDCG